MFALHQVKQQASLKIKALPILTELRHKEMQFEDVLKEMALVKPIFGEACYKAKFDRSRIEKILAPFDYSLIKAKRSMVSKVRIWGLQHETPFRLH